MIKPCYAWIIKSIFIIGLCLSLIACDGGIFGTGDGDTAVDVIQASPSVDSDTADGVPAGSDTDNTSESDGTNIDAGLPPVGVAPPVDPNAPESESNGDSSNVGQFTQDFLPSRDAVGSVNGLLSFSNSVVIEGSATEITFVNDTNMTIGLFNSSNTSEETSARPLALIPPDAIGTAFIFPNDEALFFDEITTDGMRNNQVAIDPLSVVNGSQTVAVLSDTPTGTTLFAMPAYNTEETNGAIPRRFMVLNLAGDPAVPSTLTLTPDASFDGSSELSIITFDPITANLPITNFQNVPPGEYLLNDDIGRLTNIRVQVREDDTLRTSIIELNNSAGSIDLDL